MNYNSFFSIGTTMKTLKYGIDLSLPLCSPSFCKRHEKTNQTILTRTEDT